jgi:hypothetical protein
MHLDEIARVSRGSRKRAVTYGARQFTYAELDAQVIAWRRIPQPGPRRRLASSQCNDSPEAIVTLCLAPASSPCRSPASAAVQVAYVLTHCTARALDRTRASSV